MAKVEKKQYQGKLITSLADISHEIRRFDDALNATEGELTEELNDELEGYIQNKERLEEIMLELQQLYRYKIQQVEIQESLILNIATKKERLMKSAEFYKSTLQAIVKNHGSKDKTDKGLDKFFYETNVFKFSMSPTQSTEIIDIESIPEEYKTRSINIDNLSKEAYDKLKTALDKNGDLFPKVKVDQKADKVKIKEDITSGKDVSGAVVNTNYTFKL